MLPTPKGAEMEINSREAPRHRRGMSPSVEPRLTRAAKAATVSSVAAGEERGRRIASASRRQVKRAADTNCQTVTQLPERTGAGDVYV